jgi:hypothetical protein
VGGFDITSKLLPYENFTLTLQIYLADTFGLPQNYTISITDVYLYITYSETFSDPIQENWLFLGLFIIALAAAIVTGGYFIAYHLYLKYPVPVRKVRKYRKTLSNDKGPDVPIIPPDRSFKRVYDNEISNSSKFLKGTPANGKILKEKMIDKKPLD